MPTVDELYRVNWEVRRARRPPTILFRYRRVSFAGLTPFSALREKALKITPLFLRDLSADLVQFFMEGRSRLGDFSPNFCAGGIDLMPYDSPSFISKPLTSWGIFLTSTLGVLLLASTTAAQNPGGSGSPKQFPSQEYYLAITSLENGELEEALAGFREAFQRSWRVGTLRFIDSIAPLVMTGECYYQQGNLTLALQQYEAALTLQVQSSGWSVRINANNLGGVGGANNTAATRGIQWGNSQRGSTFVGLPRFIPCTVGQLDTLEAVRRGGVIIPAEVIRIDIGEVLRTLAFAQFRRNQILGSLSPHYTLTSNFQTALQSEPGTGVAWIDAGIRVNLGLAEYGAGDYVKALQTLSQSQSTPDRVDHPSTPVALLAQADLQIRDKKYPLASQLLVEASLSAAQWEQYQVLAEISSRIGAVGCITLDAAPINVLQGIAGWSRKQRRMPVCYALAAGSELAACIGNPGGSDTMGKTALAASRSRGVLLPRVISQLAYASALADFSRGQIAPGNASMLTAMSFFQTNNNTGITSTLQYRLAQTIDLHQRDILSVDETLRSLETLLGDDPYTWNVEPLESLALLQSDQSAAWNFFDDLKFRRSSADGYLSLFEQQTQRRFMQALPWKHRLTAIRQIILASEKDLSQSQMLLRKQVLQRIPDLSVLTKQRDSLIPLIAQQKIAWERIEHSKNELQQFKDLEIVSSKLENLLHLLAVSRIALPSTIVGSVEVDAIAEKLHPAEAILRFVMMPSEQGQRLDAFLITQNGIERFEIAPSLELERKLIKLLTMLGLGKEKNRKFISDDFKLWQQAAEELHAGLIPDNLRLALKDHTKLVIVPEGWVWYVPFAMLPAEQLDGPRWIEQRDITFSPTASLALNCFGALSRNDQLLEKQKEQPTATWDGAVWNASFFGGKDQTEEAQKAIEFENEVPSVKVLQPIKEIIPVNLYRARPSLLLAACRAIESNTTLGSAWFDQIEAKGRITWNDLITSPLLSPEVLLVPGWSSGAATLNLGNGDELFLPAMALMMSGTKQGLLHRWNGAGSAAHTLLKRYLLEWNDHSPQEAWRRSLTALWAEQFPPSQEDVLKGAEFNQGLMPGSHALLWSGYLPVGRWIESSADTP